MLKLNDQYYIDSDKFQFILRKKGNQIKKGERKGEYTYNNISYHRTLDSLLKDYLHMRIVEGESKSIEEAVHLLNKINSNISKIGEEVDHKLWNKKTTKMKR